MQQALELIEKALQEQPNNYYFLDTKGFVLLKLGRNKEAAPVLQKALQLSPDDRVIREHLNMAKNGN